MPKHSLFLSYYFFFFFLRDVLLGDSHFPPFPLGHGRFPPFPGLHTSFFGPG